MEETEQLTDVGEVQRSSLGEVEIASLFHPSMKTVFSKLWIKIPKSLVNVFVILYSDCDLFDRVLVSANWLIIPVRPFALRQDEEE